MSSYTIPNVIAQHPRGERIMDVYSQLLTERIAGRDQAAWVHELLERNHLDTSLRGEQTYCIATVSPGLPVDRYPAWLYD